MRKKSKEDYLRTIYILYEEQEDKYLGVKSLEIAKSLKISKSSVSQMMKKLSKVSLVRLNPYSQVFLTSRGLKIAKKITHDYRVIGVFLRDILGYRSLKKLSQEAHELEHAFSQASIKRLDKFLDNPKKCPHGKIIHK